MLLSEKLCINENVSYHYASTTKYKADIVKWGGDIAEMLKEFPIARHLFHAIIQSWLFPTTSYIYNQG
jgi:hypothetical protein